MNLKGRYAIPAPPEAVWAALNNPTVLAACVPGCESVRKVSDREFLAAATVKLGPIKAHFDGKMVLDDLDPPHGCTLKGEGLGSAGFARGIAQIRLAPADGGTLLSYDAEGMVGGKLAQIGQRLIDAAVKSLADEFFAHFAEALGGKLSVPEHAMPPVHDHASVVPQSRTMHDMHAAHASPGEGPGAQIWVAGLVAVIIILLIIFGLVL